MTDLTLPDDQDEDEEMSDEESGSPDMPTTGWIGLKTVRLNDDSHRVIRLGTGSSPPPVAIFKSVRNSPTWIISN